MAQDFEELERGAATLYGDARGIWVMILFGPPKKADMLLARPALAAMAKRAPAGFPTLTWVLPEAGLSMENDARTAAAEVTNAFSKHILAQATLIELSGFQGATVRAIVAGLDMMSRSASPKKVFGELAPAIDWCARKAKDESVVDRVETLTRALHAIRERGLVSPLRPSP
jgi:hypothetical protein